MVQLLELLAPKRNRVTMTFEIVDRRLPDEPAEERDSVTGLPLSVVMEEFEKQEPRRFRGADGRYHRP